MSLSAKKRERALVDTRDQAAALLEDFQHFREVIARIDDPSRGELRRLSAILRRLLIDRAITIVATPRMGRFLFDVPDNKKYQKSKVPGIFYFLGGAPIPRITLPAKTPYVKPAEGMAKVRLDGFLSQRVMFYQNTWITRKDILDYVSYHCSGVHNASNKPKTQITHALESLRRHAKLIPGEGLQFTLTPIPKPGPISYNEDEIDILLLQLFADIFFIVHSEDTLTLEGIIRSELKATSSIE